MFFRMLALCAACTVLPATADVFTFETPSGNIDCSVGVEHDFSDIECTIHERGGDPAAPKPADCDAGWGHHFAMRNRGQVTMRCGGPGRNLSMFEVADYGVTSADWGGIQCRSSKQGLECYNADGHGFFLSRRSQRVY